MVLLPELLVVAQNAVLEVVGQAHVADALLDPDELRLVGLARLVEAVQEARHLAEDGGLHDGPVDDDEGEEELLAVCDRAAVAVDGDAGLVDAVAVGRVEGRPPAAPVQNSEVAPPVLPGIVIVVEGRAGPLVGVALAAAPDVVDALPAARDPVDAEHDCEQELGELDAALRALLELLHDLAQAEEA